MRLRRPQFCLRSALAVVTLIAMTLGVLPQIQDAREAARRTQCPNTLRQHSGFHGPGCDICEPSVVAAIRGLKGGGTEEWWRLLQIEKASKCGDADPEILTALEVATHDNSRFIRDAATSALNKLQADRTP
jgi:hypothetical protein